jgi:four helix bundle protein
MSKFKELKVWQKSKDLVLTIYTLSNQGGLEHDWGLRDQMRRAAISILSNIAEGDESGSNNTAIRYFNISKGSSAELLSQTIIAHEIGYIDHDSFNIVEQECQSISAMLEKLIQSRRCKKQV